MRTDVFCGVDQGEGDLVLGGSELREPKRVSSD